MGETLRVSVVRWGECCQPQPAAIRGGGADTDPVDSCVIHEQDGGKDDSSSKSGRRRRGGEKEQSYIPAVQRSIRPG